jgi:hypothetical protein
MKASDDVVMKIKKDLLGLNEVSSFLIHS